MATRSAKIDQNRKECHRLSIRYQTVYAAFKDY